MEDLILIWSIGGGGGVGVGVGVGVGGGGGRMLTWSKYLNNLFSEAINDNYCSDFRYESNEIFVLGVGFFLQRNFDFLISHFRRNFLYHSKVLLSWAKIRKDISPVIIFRKVMGV